MKKGCKGVQRILVLDMDDTLYRNNHKLAKELTKNINKYCTERLKLGDGVAYDMYKKYGTTINGLLKEGLIEEKDIDEYLEMAHTFPNEGRDLVKPDPKLRSFLQKVTAPIFIFTAGTRNHVERCCRCLGVTDLLIPDDRPIVDTRVCNLITKYHKEAYEICLNEITKFLEISVEPKDLVFVDDNIKNIRCAKKSGWGTCVLVGAIARDGDLRTTEMEAVDHIIEHISELGAIEELQDLFTVTE